MAPRDGHGRSRYRTPYKNLAAPPPPQPAARQRVRQGRSNQQCSHARQQRQQRQRSRPPITPGRGGRRQDSVGKLDLSKAVPHNQGLVSAREENHESAAVLSENEKWTASAATSEDAALLEHDSSQTSAVTATNTFPAQTQTLTRKDSASPLSTDLTPKVPETRSEQLTVLPEPTTAQSKADQTAEAAPPVLSPQKSVDPTAPTPSPSTPAKPKSIFEIYHSAGYTQSQTSSTSLLKRKSSVDPREVIKNDHKRRKMGLPGDRGRHAGFVESKSVSDPKSSVDDGELCVSLMNGFNNELNFHKLSSMSKDQRLALMRENQEISNRIQATLLDDELETNKHLEFIAERDGRAGDLLWLRGMEQLKDKSIAAHDPLRVNHKDGDSIMKNRPCLVYRRTGSKAFVWKGHSYGNSGERPRHLVDKTCQLIDITQKQRRVQKDAVEYSSGRTGKLLHSITFIEYQNLEEVELKTDDTMFEFAGRLEPEGYEKIADLYGLEEDDPFRYKGLDLQDDRDERKPSSRR